MRRRRRGLLATPRIGDRRIAITFEIPRQSNSSTNLHREFATRNNALRLPYGFPDASIEIRTISIR